MDCQNITDPTIRFKLDEGAYPPERAHGTDAGADLRTPFGFTLPGRGLLDLLLGRCAEMVIDTGVHFELPSHTKAELVPKSGLNVKASIVGWGLIDEGYTGSIKVKLYNLGKQTHYFDKGDKIAQLVVSPVCYPTYVQADEIEGGERGDAGFGSTGK
jgi:dUTP pyrophosphatase